MRLYTVQNKQIFSRLMLEGLKLSDKPAWAETAPWDQDVSVLRCITLFPEKYDTDSETVIMFDADIDNVFVAEGAFEGIAEDGGAKLFAESALPARKYILGKYIKPVYFLTGDVGIDKISPRESAEGDIRIFDSEERYYVDCVAAKLGDKYDEFRLFSVRSFFESMAAAGRMTKTENGDYLIFTDNEGNVYPICRHFHK